MSYSVTHVIGMALVELTFAGSITGTDLKESTSACIALQKDKGVTRFLVDGDDWEVVAPLVDVLDLPDKQYWDEGVLKQTRIAVVLPASKRSRTAARFYETSCKNRGWNAQLHPNRQSAIDWLTDSGKA